MEPSENLFPWLPDAIQVWDSFWSFQALFFRDSVWLRRIWGSDYTSSAVQSSHVLVDHLRCTKQKYNNART